MPSRSQQGRLMKESFDQQAAHRPRPSTGSRHAGQIGGKARSSVARASQDAASAARLMGSDARRRCHGVTSVRRGDCHRQWNAMPAGNVRQSFMAESPLIFDRALIRRRRRRAAQFGAATFLVDRVAEDLAERLAAVMRRFDVVLDLGSPDESVRTALARLDFDRYDRRGRRRHSRPPFRCRR